MSFFAFSQKDLLYAQNLILVNLILVNFFGVLVITGHHGSFGGGLTRWKFFLQDSRTFLNQNVRNQTAGNPKFRGQKNRVNPNKFDAYYLFSLTGLFATSGYSGKASGRFFGPF